MLRFSRFLPLIFVFVCSCASEKTDSNENTKKTILAVLHEQETQWNAGNIEGYMQGYNKSDSIRFASGGTVTYGWQTTLDRYKHGYPNREAMGALTFSGIDVKILSPTYAVVFGTWTLHRAADRPSGLFTLLFQKTGGGWKIIHDHTSLGGR